MKTIRLLTIGNSFSENAITYLPQLAAADGTVEAWARSPANPVGGWYGLKKGAHAGAKVGQ